jgi:hypothetical protein
LESIKEQGEALRAKSPFGLVWYLQQHKSHVRRPIAIARKRKRFEAKVIRFDDISRAWLKTLARTATTA